MASQRLFVASGIFHPEPGGPATYLHTLLPHLQARGWDVRLLSYGDSGGTDYPYPVTRIPRRIYPIRIGQYAAAARPLLRWADVVYSHTIDLPLWGSRKAPRIIKIVGDQAWERCIRKGWVPPDTDVDDFQTGEYGAIVAQQKRSRSRQVQAMDGVIVPSDYLRRMVIGWGVPPEKVTLVYNALTPVEDLPDMPQSDARARLGLSDGPLLLAPARLTPWKGINSIIRALGDMPDVRLLVAGDGTERAKLEALAAPLADRVTFLGRVPRTQMPLYMRAADYVMLYSGYEGLPHTLLESLRVGTPVIASDKGGNPEVVIQNANGLLVPYANHEALVETLKTAFAPGKRAQLAAQADANAERFLFNTMIEATDHALRGWL